VVEIARTDADPVIDHDHLHVQEVWSIFVYPHTGAQQARIEALPGVADRRVVGVAAGQQQLHIDPPARGPDQRPPHLAGGQEIRCG